MSEQLVGGAAPNDLMHEYVTLYPEVVQAGSLQNALQAVADRAGHGLAVEPAAVARAVAFAIEQPHHVEIGEINVRPTAQA